MELPSPKFVVILTFLCLLAALNTFAGASKILVFSPTMSRSHMISNARVADALAKDGHNVTLLEVEYMVPLKVLNASKLARTLHVPGPFGVRTDVDMLKKMADDSFKPPSLLNSAFSSYYINHFLNQACEEFHLASKALLEQLRAERFDMLLTEQLTLCGSGLVPLLGIPTHILINSSPIMEHVASITGLPNPSSFVPALAESNLPDRMTLGQRFQNMMHHFIGSLFLHFGADPLTRMYRRIYGPDFPDLRDVVKESPLQLVNVDEFVDFPRPLFSNFVNIGGLGMDQPGAKGKLQEPFRTVMTQGAKGVVYFSMGSVMRSSDMPEQFKRNVFRTFAQLPEYQFVMKVEKDDNTSAELAKPLSNVFTTAWAPQTELLNHPRLKLFITHGGYNSLMEAARAGVPLISMGFFGDQHRNGRTAERNGWGLQFEKRSLLDGHQPFLDAIRNVLENERYSLSAKRTQKLVLNKPFSPEERLTKNIRFLELSGGKLPELLSESRNMSTVAMYNLDLAFLAALVCLASLVLLAMLIRLVWLKFGQIAAVRTSSVNGEISSKKKIA